MADPLSVAASVTGLIAVAGSVFTIISGFVSSMDDAPESARAALSTVDNMRMILTSIRHVMDGFSSLPGERKKMIHAKHLIIALRESIQYFSELEAIVRPAAWVSGRGCMWDRLKWLMHEKKIQRTLQHLESHTTSLSMMLNILQCESDSEARRSLLVLQGTMAKVLEQNQAILRRIEQYDIFIGTGNTSIRFFEDDGITVRAKYIQVEDTTFDFSQPALTLLEEVSPPRIADVANAVSRVALSFDGAMPGVVYEERQRPIPNTSFSRPFARNRPKPTGNIAGSMHHGVNDSVTSLYSCSQADSSSGNGSQSTIFARQDDLASADPTISHDGQDPQVHASAAVSIPLRDFEVTLEQTHVYRRIRSDKADVSFTTSVIRTQAWSMLSELSLNDISIVSVIALPITLDDINSIAPQLTFANVISGIGGPPQELSPAEPWLPSVISSGEFTAHQGLPDPDRGLRTQGLSSTDSRGHKRTRTAIPTHHDVPEYKLALLGEGGCGKGAMCIKFTFGDFVDSYDPSIEECYSKHAVIDSQTCSLEILETSGQEEYAPLREQWIRDNEGFLLVYSVTSRSSLSKVFDLYEEVLAVKGGTSLGCTSSLELGNAVSGALACPMILVGNMSDRENEREVSLQEGVELASQLKCPFVETSARHGTNVEKAFFDLVRMIRLRRKAMSKDTKHSRAKSH